MKFIKSNFDDIIKPFVNQIGIAILSLVLYTALNISDDPAIAIALKVLISVFSCVFYFCLIYIASWDFGARDKIRIDSGSIGFVKAKGALISLISNSINLVLAFGAIISILIHIISPNEVSYDAFAVFNLFLRFINSMFIGIIQFAFSSIKDNVNAYYLWQSILYFLAPIITILISHFGYEMGMKEKRIFGYLFTSITKK